VTETAAPRPIAHETRRLFELALPLMGAQLAQMGMGVTDAVMAGRYSSVDLAGIALGGSVFWPVMLLVMGLVQAVTPTVAQLNGANRRGEIGEVIRQGLWLAFTGGMIAVVILNTIGPVYLWMDVDPLAVATFLRLVEADIEDVWLVTGMNRLRHAYIDLEPELERYFVASHHDDPDGILQTYSYRCNVGVSHLFSGSPVIVGTIDAVLVGVLTAIVGLTLNAAVPLQVAIGCLTGFTAASLLGFIGVRKVRRDSNGYRPLFPG
jgi:hypothetical protein